MKLTLGVLLTTWAALGVLMILPAQIAVCIAAFVLMLTFIKGKDL